MLDLANVEAPAEYRKLLAHWQRLRSGGTAAEFRAACQSILDRQGRTEPYEPRVWVFVARLAVGLERRGLLR